MGQVVAGDWKSYQYLVESIRQFPSQASDVYIAVDQPSSSVWHDAVMYSQSW